MREAKNPKIVIGKTDKELQHEVFYNPEANEFAMVEGKAKDWVPTERGVLKFLWIVWGIMTFLAANLVFGGGEWGMLSLPMGASGFDIFVYCLSWTSLVIAIIWIPFTIYLIAYTAGWPIFIFWRG